MGLASSLINVCGFSVYLRACGFTHAMLDTYPPTDGALVVWGVWFTQTR
jgi:hypothetical protein